MLRYKTETRPGLVALFDIRSGNGAGQFLTPELARGGLFGRPLSNSFNLPHHTMFDPVITTPETARGTAQYTLNKIK